MNPQDHIDTIIQAQNLITEAIDMLQFVADRTLDAWADTYLIAHLRILNSADNGHITRDANLDDWIEKLYAQQNPHCPFCDGPIEPDPTRPGVTICLQCDEPAAFTPTH